jgi:ABC-type glycerol-3-phosphate transport system substrate-binding protein
MKKAIALFLALILLLPAAISCAESGGESTTDNGAGSVAPGATTVEETDDLYDADGYLKDRIPESINYGGEVVNVLYWNNAKNVEYTAEDDGDSVNSSIYYRNLAVEDRIGVTFNWIGEKGDYSQRKEFNTMIASDLSGDCLYDIISAYSTTIAMAATNGYARDLMEYSGILSLDMPWWGSDLTDMATINGKLYFATGDISTNYLLRMYGTFFNKSTVSDNKLEDPYALVDSGEWTVDKFISIASTITGEPTGETVKYGFVHDAITVEALFYGSDLCFVDKDSNDMPKLSDSWNGDHALTLAEKLSNYCKTASVLGDSKLDESTFTSGNALFIIYPLDFAMNYLHGSDVDFGIVPIPKYNSAQKDYSTTLNYKYSLYMISAGSDIPEVAAYALEALASSSYRTVTPNLYEVAMKIRYTTDETSQRMIDHIRNGVSFEVGRTFTHVFDYETYRAIRKALSGTAEEGWSSTAAGLETAFERQLSSLINSDPFKK